MSSESLIEVAAGRGIESPLLCRRTRGGDMRLCSDMGGIYTLSEQPGTVLRNNLIHDVNALVYGGWGIYLDQATTSVLVEKNIVYNCNHAGFNQNFGRENLVRNNIFVFNPQFQWTRNRTEPHVSFMYFDQGLLLGNNWAGGLKLNRNLYFPTGPSARTSPF